MGQIKGLLFQLLKNIFAVRSKMKTKKR
jgi:hypothetical protein